MATKPIKTLELHYTMIQFLIIHFTHWLVTYPLDKAIRPLFERLGPVLESTILEPKKTKLLLSPVLLVKQ